MATISTRVLLLGLAISVTAGCDFSDDTSPAREITENDFRSREESMQFVNRILPVEVPARSQAIHFACETWLDQILRVQFMLSSNDLKTLVEELQRLHDPVLPQTVATGTPHFQEEAVSVFVVADEEKNSQATYYVWLKLGKVEVIATRTENAGKVSGTE